MAPQEPIDNSPWKLYGSSEPAYVAGGHSHVVCLLSAALDDPNVHKDAAIAYSGSFESGAPNDASYWRFFADSAKGRVAVVIWNGNQHQAAFLVAPEPPLRVYHPKVSTPPFFTDVDSGTWVPRSVFREYWDWTYSEFNEVLSPVAQQSQLIVLGTPPPKTDGMVREVLQNEPIFLDLAMNLGVAPQDLRLTAPETRLALWNTIQDDMENITSDIGGTFIPVPASVRDTDGFLLPEYSAPDVTHTNSKYGSVMWREIYKTKIEANSN